VSQLAPRQQHPVFALAALQANIRAQPDNLPVKAAAGMRFAQPHHIIQS